MTILNGIKNIYDSWEKVKISTLIRVWKKPIAILMDDSEGLKTSVEEVNADVVEITRELKLEVEPEDGAECCNLMIKLSGMRSLPLTDKQRKWFLKTESTPGVEAVHIIEMKTN